MGIYLRPDLREEAYQARIDHYEVKKEILRMVPGLNLFANGNYDSNQYLLHQAWAEAGARTTMDILGMASKFKQYKASKTQVEVGRTRRLASTLAALVQINMSYYQYRQAVELFGDAERLNVIEGKLFDLTKAAAQAREAGELDRIKQSAMSLNARLEQNRSLIEVFSAWGNLYFSVGGDLMTGVTGEEDLGQLILITEASLDNWLAGGLPPLPADAPALPNGHMAITSFSSLASVPSPTPVDTAPVRFEPSVPASAPVLEATEFTEFAVPAPEPVAFSGSTGPDLRRPAQVLAGRDRPKPGGTR